jgi:hypothetical protein
MYEPAIAFADAARTGASGAGRAPVTESLSAHAAIVRSGRRTRLRFMGYLVEGANGLVTGHAPRIPAAGTSERTFALKRSYDARFVYPANASPAST